MNGSARGRKKSQGNKLEAMERGRMVSHCGRGSDASGEQVPMTNLALDVNMVSRQGHTQIS